MYIENNCLQKIISKYFVFVNYESKFIQIYTFSNSYKNLNFMKKKREKKGRKIRKHIVKKMPGTK